MISVCLATCNGEKYIKKQILSILQCIPPEAELIISDDASVDKTLDIIKSIADSRISLFHSNFRSITKNFEFLISKSKGIYIFLSDQDDIWTSDKVDSMLFYFNSGYDVLVSDCNIIDQNDSVLHNSFLKISNLKRGFMRNLVKNNYIGCCMAFHTKIKPVILPFPEKIPMHDWWIGLLSELYFKTYFINTPLVFYRSHDENNSDTANGLSTNSIYKKIRLRVILFYLILKRVISLLC